jgi:hypothetical protein
LTFKLTSAAEEEFAEAGLYLLEESPQAALARSITTRREATIPPAVLTRSSLTARARTIGYQADVGSGALTNATVIGANAKVNQSNAVILGSGADVGIKTSAPQSELDIEGGGTITLAARSTDPTTPAAGTWRLYIYVNGGTHQLRIKSPAGTLTGMNLNP